MFLSFITYHSSLIAGFVEVEDDLVAEALRVARDGHHEEQQLAHRRVFERECALIEHDVARPPEEE